MGAYGICTPEYFSFVQPDGHVIVVDVCVCGQQYWLPLDPTILGPHLQRVVVVQPANHATAASAD